MAMDALIIDPPARRDLDAIMAIEQVSFVAPWDMLTLFLAMEDPLAQARVARLQDRLVGYCFAVAMRDMLHLLNLAVDPACRRQGIARRLLEELIEVAHASQCPFIFLEVRSSNAAARALYRAMGFDRVCVWRGYYQETREDAHVMLKRVS